MCNAKTSIKHIRLIFATLVLAEDNLKSFRLQREFDTCQEQKNRAESENMQLNFKLDLKDKEIDSLKNELKNLKDKAELYFLLKFLYILKSLLQT